jgi:hypothetical protein
VEQRENMCADLHINGITHHIRLTKVRYVKVLLVFVWHDIYFDDLVAEQRRAADDATQNPH